MSIFLCLPYLRGYYDVVAAPLSPEALLNFYLPLILVLILGFWFYKVRMPRYFHEAIYNQKARKPQAKAVTRSQRQVLIRHHLSTLGNSTLIINTYVVPVLYMIMLGGGAVFLKDLGSRLFRTPAFGRNCLWFLFSSTNKFSWCGNILRGDKL